MDSGPASPSREDSVRLKTSSSGLLLGFLTSAPWPLVIGCALTAGFAVAALLAALFAMWMIALSGMIALSMVARIASKDPAFDRKAFKVLNAEEVSRTRKLARVELLSKWNYISNSKLGKYATTGFSDLVKLLTGLEVSSFIEIPRVDAEGSESLPKTISGWVRKFLEDEAPVVTELPRKKSSLSFDSKDGISESRKSELDLLAMEKASKPNSRSLSANKEKKVTVVTDFDATPESGDHDSFSEKKTLDPYPFPGVPKVTSRLIGHGPNHSTRMSETTGKRMVIPFESKSSSSKLTVVKDESRHLEILKLLPVIPSDETIVIPSSVTLTEFLSVPEIRDDFRMFMQKKLCTENMDFIDAVDLYRNLSPERRAFAARNIYQTFILSTGTKCINIDGDTTDDVKEKITNGTFTEDLFNKAYEVIIRVMEQDVFIQYKSNSSFDPTIRKVIRSVLRKTKAPRLEGWVNSEKYVSLQVNVTDITDIKLNSVTGKEKIYFSITVDSTCVPSEQVKPTQEGLYMYSASFKEPMRFQISSTTQYIEIEVFETSTKRFLGRLFVPLLFVVRSQGGFQDLELVSSPRVSSDEEVTGRIRLAMTLSAAFSPESPSSALVRRRATVTTFALLNKAVGPGGPKFTGNGFDLDLTYITEHLIAMAEPGRVNSIEDLAKFFELRHSNCFKIFCLGPRKPGDAKLDFYIECLPVAEKAPAAFNMILEFCKQIDAWLNAFPQNVAAVYCKTGKGRTGMMICSYLLYSGRCTTADQAIEYFNNTRCGNSKGLTRPGHLQYIKYVEHYLKVIRELGPSLFPETKKLYVRAFSVLRAPVLLRNGLQSLCVEFYQKDGCYSSGKNDPSVIKDDTVIITFAKPVPISEDITVRLYISRIFRREHFLSFYFNTRFVEENTLILEKEVEIHNKKESADKNSVSLAVALEVFYSAKAEHKDSFAELLPSQSPASSISPSLERETTGSMSSSLNKILRPGGSHKNDEDLKQMVSIAKKARKSSFAKQIPTEETSARGSDSD